MICVKNATLLLNRRLENKLIMESERTMKDKMDLLWGIEQMESKLSKIHSPASNIMNICSEVTKQVKMLINGANIEDIKLHGMDFNDSGLNMKLSGESVSLFYMFLIKLFYSCGGTNFLTLSVQHENDKFEITIKNCNGNLTPAEKIEHLTKELDDLKLLHSA